VADIVNPAQPARNTIPSSASGAADRTTGARRAERASRRPREAGRVGPGAAGRILSACA
jgi:hypothetical protein